MSAVDDGVSCEQRWAEFRRLRDARARLLASPADKTRNFTNPRTPFPVISGTNVPDFDRPIHGEYTHVQLQMRRKYEALKCLDTADVSSGRTKLRTQFAGRVAPRHIQSRIACSDEVPPGTRAAPLPGPSVARHPHHPFIKIDPRVTLIL